MTRAISSLFRSAPDMEQIPDGAELPEVIDIINKSITYLGQLNKLLSIQSNFDGYIAENIEIGVGLTAKIQHYLGVMPKWRIILRQTGNGVITDVNSTPSDWNDKIISLKNNGAETVILTVFIARE